MFGTLTATFENLLANKGVVRAGERVIQTGEGVTRPGGKQDFWCRLIISLDVNYKNVIKTNLDSMVFIQGIIYVN